jgi:hypothetical protein
MALIPLQLPPGVYRNGTELQSAGRWFNSSLVRWFEGTIRPVQGWRKRSQSGIGGIARGLFAWEDNDGDFWVSVGTHDKLWVYRVDGALAEITPTGLVDGLVDAGTKTGYGYGGYGAQQYGTERLNLEANTPATMWSMDSWGEYLLACSNFDGKIYEWQLGFSTPNLAVALTNAPVNNKAVMVTSERFVFALGAGGNTRKVQWCDQENNTVWTPTALNQAGDYELVTAGTLLAGKRVRGIHLLWTDIDCHSAQYVGQPFVYGFEKIGSGCGLISAQSVAVVSDTSAIWMSNGGFWIYDGAVKPLQSDVSDYVFRNMNAAQRSKVYAVHNSQFGEVWWYYPSEGSTEIDSYVSYNYREGHWAIGLLARSSGTGPGAFDKPLMMGVDGFLYEHELGVIQDQVEVFAESGPIQIGAGDNVMSVTEVIPDELNQGDVDLSFTTKLYPNGVETSHGPYSTANPTSVRFTGRQVKMKLEQNRTTFWRVGTMRLNAVGGGRR